MRKAMELLEDENKFLCDRRVDIAKKLGRRTRMRHAFRLWVEEWMDGFRAKVRPFRHPPDPPGCQPDPRRGGSIPASAPRVASDAGVRRGGRVNVNARLRWWTAPVRGGAATLVSDSREEVQTRTD